ncbi:MAG TPA: hypothetical protein VEY96_08530 [Actinomycetes bacterium]|nr:hypothetical protein [Actinomycetes bacterium]
MAAPTLDRHPGSSQGGSSGGPRRRRRQLVLAAGALLVVAVAVGTSLAIATRPIDRQAAAAAAANDQNANAGQAAQPEQAATDDPPAKPESSEDPGAAGTDDTAPALEDGDHEAYITEVDSANDRIVVDVVQVFHDNDAVKAAIADGRSPSDAKYLTTWVRNENPRLRTLPLAGDLVVKLRDACGEPGNDREALLTKLAANASLKGTYYYTLSVDDGTVQRIQERLAINAC